MKTAKKSNIVAQVRSINDDIRRFNGNLIALMSHPDTGEEQILAAQSASKNIAEKARHLCDEAQARGYPVAYNHRTKLLSLPQNFLGGVIPVRV